ncbi:histone H1.0-B-like [Asterias rubens]|uniref:histone H1.0-B-like n=1 Tax=Asterias rubens TaxID=7604 RepID=UPI0014552E16|nr:histone H1.0-B-like [Asterias rubens]
MADTVATPKAKKPATPKKRTAPQHPPYESMINEAVRALDDKKGSSRQAIIKYIKNAHRLEQTNVETRIKLALKRMAAKGVLTHTKGSGASGSFRVPADSSKAAGKGKKKTTKKTTPKKVKKPPVSAKPSKKAASVKAKSPKTKKPAAKTEAKKKPAATPKKSKKAATKKPKASPKKSSTKPKKAPATVKPKKSATKKVSKKGGKKGAKK